MSAYDFEDCRDRLRRATEVILAAESQYQIAIEQAADSEAFYRIKLGESFERFRAAGQAVEAAKIAAHAECAVHSRARDVDAGTVKLRAEQLDDARDSRRSLWRMIEWARGRDLATAGADHQRGETWP